MTLTEYLKSIADAIRTKKTKVDTINAMDFANEIMAIEPIYDSCEITENGNHNVTDYKTAVVHVPTNDTALNLLNRDVEEYTIPYGITKIIPYIFREWSTLKNITIPETVTRIEDYAFQGCGITSINIPDSVTYIGNRAFEKAKLSSVTIHEFVTTLGSYVFNESRSLTKAVINAKIQLLPSYIFYRCTSLKEVTLPNTITQFGSNAFSECTSLNKINIPESVVEFGESCFSQCPIEEITIPNGMTRLLTGCFSGTKIKVFFIPESVTQICQAALYSNADDYVVIMESETPPTLYNSTHFNTSKLNKIYVPKGTSETYKSKAGWSIYADYIFEFNSVNFYVDSNAVNNENCLYSLDNGKTWEQFTKTQFTLDNIHVVCFKSTNADSTMVIGTTQGGSDVATIANAETIYATPSDTSIYITLA